MGCTSSAPNMPTANANPTDKTIHFSDDTKDDIPSDKVINRTDDGNGTIEKVLPPCDTLGESIQLDRNNKSLIDIPHTHADKDTYTNGHVMDGDNTLNKDDSQVEEKLSTLEDVVEKVVELYIADNAVDDASNVPESSTEQSKNMNQNSGIVEEIPGEISEQIHSAETKPMELISTTSCDRQPISNISNTCPSVNDIMPCDHKHNPQSSFQSIFMPIGDSMKTKDQGAANKSRNENSRRKNRGSHQPKSVDEQSRYKMGSLGGYCGGAASVPGRGSRHGTNLCTF